MDWQSMEQGGKGCRGFPLKGNSRVYGAHAICPVGQPHGAIRRGQGGFGRGGLWWTLSGKAFKALRRTVTVRRAGAYGSSDVMVQHQRGAETRLREASVHTIISICMQHHAA